MNELHQENEELRAKVALLEEILRGVSSCPNCRTCQQEAEEWFNQDGSYRTLARMLGVRNGRWRGALLKIGRLVDEALGRGDES